MNLFNAVARMDAPLLLAQLNLIDALKTRHWLRLRNEYLNGYWGILGNYCKGGMVHVSYSF